MKTTIDFPDELLHRAEVMAAEQRTILRDLMVRALEQLTESATEKENARKDKIRRLLNQMKAANTVPIKPLTRDELHER